MSKAISSYPSSEKGKVIARRIRGATGGLGYLSAVDAKAQGATVQETTESVKTETEK